MRNLESLRLLNTAEALIDFMSQDPLDRVLDRGSDLSPNELAGGALKRPDNGILIVRSMRALGVKTISEYIKARQGEMVSFGAQPGDLAIIGVEHIRDHHGRIIPNDIQVLCKAAEDQQPGRLLSWAGYEGLCVLATHPEAEVGEADWFVPKLLQARL
ncbi:hypothetical protein [Pseudomonas monteilii]|uniref:hypothetical protein n=1 Tax=Pseudomonas monteilii TaxID=76759 RepID=UPI0015FE0B93|nr:hypothetical protein [Pseudomonas monteilii]MBA6105273.1 hypothetical protein [Pseudomonas monteilii]